MKQKAFGLVLTIIFLLFLSKEVVWAGATDERVSNIEVKGKVATDIFEEEIVWGTVYLCDYYDVKEQMGVAANTVISVPSGTTVQLLSLETNSEGEWCKVKAVREGVEYFGYIQRKNLAISNEHFLNSDVEIELYKSDSTVDYKDVEQFPTSYQDFLYDLKQAHPNWIFVRQDIPMKWDYVIENEIVGDRSLIGTYRGAAWKNGKYSTNWAYASQDAVEYYMDPRNFLTENDIFQFEQLTYNVSYHSEEATQNILQNTFMNGLMPGGDITYAQAFVEIGAALGVSPFHIASRVAQEQGKGTSPLISGEYVGYEGYYNYFNIGASGNSDEAVYKSGLETAKKNGWTSPYLSISGGAKILSKDYIMCGQDTLYLQKFDVDSSYKGVFYHQYMQNVEAPTTEAKKICKAYRDAGAIENTFVFKIPVYESMPNTPCVNPEVAIKSAGIFIVEADGERIVAGAVTDTNQQVDLEYRWLQYDIALDAWSELQGWKVNNEWCTWYPPKTGDYLLHVEVRVAGKEEVTSATIGYNFVSDKDIKIKGMCQMPYTGEGGGFLIGVETDKNPDQKLRYELLIMDCTLYAEGKPAWIWSTGLNTVAEGNAFWAVWQPQYGYYFTYFRVYDEEGNIVADECYGFANV